MDNYRIVFNELSNKYRVERRRWWGWSFVTDAGGDQYLTFETREQARQFICQKLAANNAGRRWKIVDICERNCANC